jgi:hypothetical protein
MRVSRAILERPECVLAQTAAREETEDLIGAANRE